MLPKAFLHMGPQGVLALDQNPWRGYRVVLSHISDVALNDHTVIDLEPENEWSGNKLLRAATIARFKKHLQRSLDTMKSSGTCNHSIIFQTVAAEANRLAASGAATKYLIVVSDLMEHSTVSFYDRTTLTTLQSNPDRITKQLETITPLSSLANMQVWLLNSPGSYEQNTTYMIVAGFYKHHLEAKGAQVHINTKFQAL